jgi:hypothetical protein
MELYKALLNDLTSCDGIKVLWPGSDVGLPLDPPDLLPLLCNSSSSVTFLLVSTSSPTFSSLRALRQFLAAKSPCRLTTRAWTPHFSSITTPPTDQRRSLKRKHPPASVHQASYFSAHHPLYRLGYLA